MERRTRILTLAPYLACPLCACRGWRPDPTQTPNLEYATEMSACKRCSHAAQDHGGLKNQSDVRLADLVVRLKQRLTLKKAEDAREQMLVRLKSDPPFESPTIVEIFRNYLLFAYGDAGVESDQRSRLNELCNFILSVLDQNILPNLSPEAQEDKHFAPFFSLWKRYCDLGQHRLTKVFGRGMLLHLYPVLKTAVLSPNLPLSVQMKDFAPRFLEGLINEVRNDKSPIFRPDAYEVLSQRITVAVAADFARRNSLSKSSSMLRRSGHLLTSSSMDAPRSLYQSSDVIPVYPTALGKRTAEMMSSAPGNPYMEEGVVSLGPSCSGLANSDIIPQEYPEGIVFRVVQNDGTPESLMRLTDMKQIFHKQLPKMPTGYIARLVFDLNHKTLVCMLDGRSIGGITFRPFPEQQFVEITFCAVTTDRQVRGYGSLIMTHLKAYCQYVGLLHFLTYADSFAVGYFSKQGFSAKVTLPREAWVGRIKDYEGATLMHCVLHPTLNYVAFQDNLAHARSVTEQRMDVLSGGGQVYKGLAQFRGKKKKERIENLAEIPGVLESGWKPEDHVEADVQEGSRLYDKLDSLLQSIKRHSYAWPFRTAVDRSQVPQYYKVISDPIDLSMIEERLRSQSYYISSDLFIADLRRMLDNCKVFNDVQTSYHKCAVALGKFLAEHPVVASFGATSVFEGGKR